MPAEYQIEFVKSARKEFEGLPKKIQDRVVESLGFLAKNPFSELLRVKKLKGAEALYRVRVSDYRVVYEVKKDVLLILVIKIGHRREVYRSL